MQSSVIIFSPKAAQIVQLNVIIFSFFWHNFICYQNPSNFHKTHHYIIRPTPLQIWLFTVKCNHFVSFLAQFHCLPKPHQFLRKTAVLFYIYILLIEHKLIRLPLKKTCAPFLRYFFPLFMFFLFPFSIFVADFASHQRRSKILLVSRQIWGYLLYFLMFQ